MGGGADNRFHIASRQEIMDEAYTRRVADVAASNAIAAEVARATAAEVAGSSGSNITIDSDTAKVEVITLDTNGAAWIAVDGGAQRGSLALFGPGGVGFTADADSSGGTVQTSDGTGAPRNILDDGLGAAVIASTLTIDGIFAATVVDVSTYVSAEVTARNAAIADAVSAITIPTVTSVTPNTGLHTDATSVTIIGTGFWPGCTVTAGGVPCTGVVVVDQFTITCTLPVFGSGGVTDLRVTSIFSQSPTIFADRFTYT